MKRIVFYIVTMLAVSACVYPYSVDLEETAKPELVIDANILLGNTSTVNLSYLQPLEVGQKMTAVSGRASGNVYLEDESGHIFKATSRYGTYELPNIVPSDNSKYRLTVEVDGNIYRSEWIEPTAPPTITDVRFSADNTQVYVQVSIQDEGEGSGYAAATVEEIWNFHTDYMRMYAYNVLTNSVEALMAPDDKHYWCWKKNVSGTVVPINYSSLNGVITDYPVLSFWRTDSRNHQEYDVRVKVWNLTPEQYRYRKMLEENESIGGNLFSPEPGEVRGNIYCENDASVKVYGYVNISQVVIKDAVLPSTYDMWKVPNTLVKVSPEDYLTMFERGYSPVDDVQLSDGSTYVGWGLERCYDCIAAGGTLEKPSFD